MCYGKGMKKTAVMMPYLLATIVCLCISIPVLSQSVVLDEAYSIVLVRDNIRGIIQGAAEDVHPPLYYLILKFCSLFGGESLVKYRIGTLLATYLNLLVLGATLIRRRWGNKTAIFYILWFGSVYCTFELSVLIRMYSWAAFFVTAAALHVFFFYENGRMRDYVLSILMTLAAMYTHYYAVMAVFLAWLILLIAVIVCKRERLKWFLAGGICITAGYLPWIVRALFFQAASVARNYWVTAVGWKEWFSTPAQLMDCSLVGIGGVLYFLVFILLILALLRKKKEALLFFCIFAGTMGLGQGLSVLVAPIWQNRYLYVAWGMLSLFVAIIAGQKVSEHSFVSHILLGCMLCMVLVFSVQTELQGELMTGNDKEWVRFLEEQVREDALVIIDDPGEHNLVFRYYLPNVQIIMSEELMTEEGREELRVASEKVEQRQIWYIIDHIQAQLGYDKIAAILKNVGLELGTEPVSEYAIRQKILGVYSIGENANEEKE